ncbi:MAG: hypothetical protein SPLUMA2_SPLUMAMAG2_01604 [uncultured Sulfurimonas sp.]|nr:MAG: hypothetical protein SPLUMA2_SPLUMAMAG2_01604 [uncultured Sulfurimonas sp.]
MEVVQNLATSSEVLDTLARDPKVDELSKTFIARHPNTSAKTLVYLLRYDKVEMMGAIAAHTNTSPEILEMMVKSSDKLYTQYKLAQNPNTPALALDELCDEADSEEVKLAIAQNPSTSLDTLKGLFDENSLISIEAQKNYDEQEVLKNKRDKND